MGDKINKAIIGLAAATFCGVMQAANTTVPANETLVLETADGTFENRSASEDYKLIANDGSRLVVPLKDSITNCLPGFAMFVGKDVPAGWPESDSEWFACCDYLRTISTPIWLINNGQNTADIIRSEVCLAYWTVSEEEAGTYSFWEHFNGNAMVVLDGTVVLRDTNGNLASCVQGIEVSAGVHELTVAFGSLPNWTWWGPKENFSPAFRFSKTNANLLADPLQGRQWDPAVDNLKGKRPAKHIGMGAGSAADGLL